MFLGVDVWTSLLVNYNVPYGKKLYLSNGKAKHAILTGLSESELVKVIHGKYAYKMWEKFNHCHEGDDTLKQAKLHNFIIRFEKY